MNNNKKLQKQVMKSSCKHGKTEDFGGSEWGEDVIGTDWPTSIEESVVLGKKSLAVSLPPEQFDSLFKLVEARGVRGLEPADKGVFPGKKSRFERFFRVKRYRTR